MKKVLLAQPNFKIGTGNFEGYWLPYSVGCLWAYAMQHDWVQENFQVQDIIFKRNKVNEYVDALETVDIAFFSCYMWNWEYNKVLAKAIKEKYPNCVIVFGGPQVSNKPEQTKFFEKYPYVDSICLLEGEPKFVEMLHNVLEDKPLDKIYKGARLHDLDVPSPYSSGVFDKIIQENPNIKFNTTLETNRGCPFACTFCDWGSLTYAKIRKFPIEKVYEELEWIAKNKIDYLTIADANFGVFYERDMAITDKLIDLQKQYGYPAVVDATWYKNASEKILKIVKKFAQSGFNRGLTLSVQSMDDTVLEEIKRKNMEISDLKDIFAKCNAEGIKSYTELILGLPYETYDTWCDGLCTVIDAGQHGAIESWFAQILENAELNSQEQKLKHGIQTVVASDYVSGHEEADNILETAELITGTKYMPNNDLIDSWAYSWIINNFHCFGWTQVYTRFMNSVQSRSYREMYDDLLYAVNNDTGIVNTLLQIAKREITFYLKNGKVLQNNGHTLLWDAQKKFHTHRQEILDFVDNVYVKNYIGVDEDLYLDLKKFQHNFTTDPYSSYPYTLGMNYNLNEFLNGKNLTKGSYVYTIDIIEKDLPVHEYTARLYYRRRQGWGKSIVTLTNL